jgi:VWFA-related protein
MDSMTFRQHRVLTILCSFVLAFHPCIKAQSQKLPPAIEDVRLRTDLVLLDVGVIRKQTGELVSDLTKEDFTVYEDDVRQEIVHFQREDLAQTRQPLSIVLAVSPVDVSTIDSVAVIERAAQASLEKLGQDDEVALMVFATRTRLLQELTTDRKLILEKMPLVNDIQDLGGMQLVDEVIYQAAEYLEKASSPLKRRIILVVMSGNLPSARAFKGHSPREALLAVYQSNALVYGIIVRTPEPGGWQFLKWWLKVNPVNAVTFSILRGGSLKKYAEATGGEVLAIRQGQVATLLPEVIARIQARYMLGYLPSNSKRDGKFHSIKVKLARDVEKRYGQLVIRAREGYMATVGQKDEKK